MPLPAPLRLAAPLLVGLLLAGPAPAQPASDPDGVVAEVEAAYERLDYDAAEALAREALADFEAYAPDQLVRLHTLLGLIAYARGESLAASAQFRAALTLDRTLTLDPLLVSPATIGFFEETKATFLREQASGTAPLGEGVRYVVVYDPRPSAFVRSLVLPGWGQRYKRETAKGWALTGVWAAGIAGAATAEVMRRDARDAYLTESDPGLVESRYATLNRWHWARNGLTLGVAAVWVYAAFDAGVLGGNGDVAVQPMVGGAALNVRF